MVVFAALLVEEDGQGCKKRVSMRRKNRSGGFGLGYCIVCVSVLCYLCMPFSFLYFQNGKKRVCELAVGC